MADFIAACGLDCEACEAYIATQTRDEALALAVAQKWGERYGDGTPFPIEAVSCDGCLTEGPRKGGYCGQCPIRACVQQRGVESCARCADYSCDTLEGFLKAAPELRQRLEHLREAARPPA